MCVNDENKEFKDKRTGKKHVPKLKMELNIKFKSK